MSAPSRAADLIHKVWFITGASSGLGLELAHAALKRGDFVVATSRAVTSVLGDHDNLLSVRLDVTDEAQAVAAAKAAVERFGRIDVLVNSAGYGLLGGVEEASGKEVEQQFATNVFGLLNVARALLKLVDSDKPPLRLPLGTDTVARIAEKHRLVEAELERWLDVAKSTDHDDVAK